jgi:flagellar hook-associated protein 3 FlgL
MRVPDKIRALDLDLAQARAAARVDAAARRAATGLRVETPSDDPLAFGGAVATSARIVATSARLEAIQRVSDDAGLAEGALASASDLLVRAREIAIAMSNGTLDAAARATAAKEVQSLRDGVIAAANTRGSLGYLFGGTKTAAPPFTTAGAFVGDDGALKVEVAEATEIVANTSGAKAFTALGGTDVFAVLANLATALSANDIPNVRAAIDAVDAAHRQVVGARVDSGLTLERLRSAATITRTAVDRLKVARADFVEADALESFGELQRTREAFEVSLTVTKQILALPTLAKM